MSVYTSLKLTRNKARQIVFDAMDKDEHLKAMLNAYLERETLYNCVRLVDNHDEKNDDHKLDLK